MVFIECPALTTFETGLAAKLGLPAVADFYCDLGHRLAAAKTIPAADVPGASAGAGATLGLIGAIKAKCHGMGGAR